MSGRSPRLLLVDGSSYVYRAFFALPPLAAPDGRPTNAVYGFTTMMLKLLGEAKPEYLAVVLDAPGPTFRDELFDSYKANRPPPPSDLMAQMDLIPEVARALGVKVIVKPGVEADDVIATLVERLASEGVDCVVVTGDKDLMQLVGPHVRLWDTMRDRWVDEATVEERFGVTPQQLLDVMALMGDSVDNIPGVKGIGEKGATALIREFGDLDGVLRRLHDVESSNLRGARKLARLLQEGQEMARLSRELASLKRDVPLTCGLEDLRVGERDSRRLRELWSRLGFQSLLRQLCEDEPIPQASAEVLRDAGRLGERLRQARRDGWLPMCTLCEPGPAVTTPAREIVLGATDGSLLRVPLDREDVLSQLRESLAGEGFELLVHDLKRDLLALKALGVEPSGRGFDVMIASYLLEATPTHALAELARNLAGAHAEGFRATAEGTTAGVALLPRLREQLSARLTESDLDRLFGEVEMPVARLLARMEHRGVLLDTRRLEAMSAEFEQRLAALMTEVHDLAGGEFNINSPPQLRQVLFERLGLPTKGVRKGKTGYSTDVDVLTRLSVLHPLPAKILEYRALTKLKSTYIDVLPAAVNAVTGRLHTTFNQTVAATGRLSSSDPNLQNIPIRGEHGRRIREAFVAPGGAVLLAADYSQIELRVLAHLSGDRALLEAFRTDQDIHARTAAEVFGGLPGTITPDMRRAAKVINFGIIYGMGPPRLAQELGVSVAEAQRYIAGYFDRYPGVREYMRGIAAEGRRLGYVTTILGRRRQVPDLRSTNRAAAQAAERAAANTPIQGSAADIIKVAMVAVERRLEREGLPAALILQVHDELLLETAENEYHAVAAAVREEMERAMPLDVPLRVEIASGRSWAEAH